MDNLADAEDMTAIEKEAEEAAAAAAAEAKKAEEEAARKAAAGDDDEDGEEGGGDKDEAGRMNHVAAGKTWVAWSKYTKRGSIYRL